MSQAAAPSKPRKRLARKPIQARAAATRGAILEAAAQLFGREGFAAVSTNRLAERAGVSVGSLYEYFRSKDDILAALLDAHLIEGERRMTDAASRAAIDPVAALVDGFVAFHAADPKLHRVLAEEAPRHPKMKARAAALEARVVDLVEAALAAAGVADARLKASVAVGAVDALAHRWIVEEGGTPASAATMIRELTDLLSAYLAPRAPYSAATAVGAPGA